MEKNKIGEYLAELQARAWLSHALCAPDNTLLKDEESEYFLNRFRFDRIVAMSVWPTFFGPPFIC